MNDIFWFTPGINIANYADDSTPYATSNDIQTLLDILQKNTEILMQWFSEIVTNVTYLFHLQTRSR